MINAILSFKKGLAKLLELTLILAVALLVLNVVWGVFTRYAMGEQANWTEELARFLLVWISMLGAALAFGTRAHLGVDYLMEKLHPEVRGLMEVTVHLIVLFFAAAVFIYGGSRVVADALAMEQTTPALGWKMGHIYLVLPVAGIFMVIFTIENLIETITLKKEAARG
ncbi:TRAP transporter small permease [Luteolibacter algae]|uniref:TRAP transporter small permease n=1 Tax=Luteolibacter algae TaxID=454151 RepID=A0ABW5DB57_9BACT